MRQDDMCSYCIVQYLYVVHMRIFKLVGGTNGMGVGTSNHLPVWDGMKGIGRIIPTYLIITKRAFCKYICM